MIPEPVLTAAQLALRAFCERVPQDLRGMLSYEFTVRRNTVILTESRPKVGAPTQRTNIDIAQFVYKPSTGTWMLKWCDRYERWHHYKGLTSVSNFQRLVDEVAADPTGIFFG
jgi:hypothetical protein